MRCCSGGTACTYERMGLASSNLASTPEVDMRSTYRETEDIETSASRTGGHISIDFLLNFTDPSGYRPSAAIAAEAVDLATEEYDLNFQISSFPSARTLAFHHQPFDNTDNFLFGYCFPLSMPQYGTEEVSHRAKNCVASNPELISALEVRAGEMVAQLFAQQSLLQERYGSIEATLDASLANLVFTAANMQHCVWAFFRYFHSQFPILHPASFDVRTVSPPLLLAVVLFGSMSCSPSDVSLAMRQFFGVAEAHIFDQLLLRTMPQCCQETWTINTEIELFQASLLFVILQNNSNDLTTRRRLRLQRIPSLIAAVRCSGLFAYKRKYPFTNTNSIEWQSFISDEIRVRYWTLE